VTVRQDLLQQVDGLDLKDPDDIARALAFLRQVVINNPGRPVDEIATRSDVTSAAAAVNGWLTRARAAGQNVADNVLASAQDEIRVSVRQTLGQLAHETNLSAVNAATWQSQGADAITPETAKVVLRMTYLKDFLAHTTRQMLRDLPYRRWVARKDKVCCSYCKALDGTVVTADESFAQAAARAGFLKIYGGLYGPPLHPNCRCRIQAVTLATV
jgi:hypothetical protein